VGSPAKIKGLKLSSGIQDGDPKNRETGQSTSFLPFHEEQTENAASQQRCGRRANTIVILILAQGNYPNPLKIVPVVAASILGARKR
jgi:hypothetical protein